MHANYAGLNEPLLEVAVCGENSIWPDFADSPNLRVIRIHLI